MKQFSVSVPATLTNLGAGFDALGLAVQIYNRITACERNRGLNIKLTGEGADTFPANRAHLVYRAMDTLFRRVRFRPKGLELSVYTNIPIGKGLGSSAACIVGGLALANALSGARLKTEELLALATKLEGHPDNILPALVGGFTVVAQDGKKLHFLRETLAPSLYAVLIVPDGHISTPRARKVLPKKVAFKDAVFNVSRAALTVGALRAHRLDLLTAGFQDRLHESYRRKLFPALTRYIQVFKQISGRPVAVSGSGPTLVTFVEGRAAAWRLGAKVRSELRRLKLKGSVWTPALSSRGARIS